ncbi:MAG: hypothetical protein UY23_C0001G0300 [Candidatus Jorgensenbacteria bacterium GW2011_GWA1_48_11]|uniref:Restriction endonuclease n=1 Tax=Candidatus Jorgensenbacteria bacterium GW2011_GWA1_48_11 TaxID=1618660 RepID=A0A0G1UC57_9BACT|nr:MAG: hypothetical protein UY23_C0001G0300 [Candidatus Jorgensenbacteria bacterium GW2011_GWA1_48_11]KKW12185.1 MAG: hypothetical protein UY51_C0005G0427 [Candidatus Jorgensenbacteria bacterium GW2011_GWB1_49_9]
MSHPYEQPFEDALERADLEIALKKARGVLAAAAIRETDFTDLYDAARIKHDIDNANSREAGFRANQAPESREMKMLADVFEAIVIEQGELNDWFGPNAFTRKTSRYDDYENGIDAIVEFEKPQEATHLGLGIDVTFTADTSKKFGRITDQIKAGRLPRIKYFSSERLHIRGELRNVPAVIIGASRKTIQELIPVWMERDNKELARHKIQFMILEEIKIQLEAFKAYALKNGKTDVANRYREALEIVKAILAGKAAFRKEISDDELKTDPVFFSIQDYIQRWRKSFGV